MKIKVSDATNTQLDWLVAKARGFDIYHDALLNGHVRRGFWVSGYFPGDPNSWMLLSQIATSTNWAQGGPIIESENITIIRCEAEYGTDRKGSRPASVYQFGQQRRANTGMKTSTAAKETTGARLTVLIQTELFMAPHL